METATTSATCLHARDESTVSRGNGTDLYQSTVSRGIDNVLYQSTVSRGMDNDLYQSTVSRGIDNVLYQSTVSRGIDNVLYQSTVSRGIDNDLYQSTVSRGIDNALYQSTVSRAMTTAAEDSEPAASMDHAAFHGGAGFTQGSEDTWKATAQQTWACPRCTLVNNRRAGKCKVCGKKRPAGRRGGSKVQAPPRQANGASDLRAKEEQVVVVDGAGQEPKEVGDVEEQQTATDAAGTYIDSEEEEASSSDNASESSLPHHHPRDANGNVAYERMRLANMARNKEALARIEEEAKKAAALREDPIAKARKQALEAARAQQREVTAAKRKENQDKSDALRVQRTMDRMDRQNALGKRKASQVANKQLEEHLGLEQEADGEELPRQVTRERRREERSTVKQQKTEFHANAIHQEYDPWWESTSPQPSVLTIEFTQLPSKLRELLAKHMEVLDTGTVYEFTKETRYHNVNPSGGTNHGKQHNGWTSYVRIPGESKYPSNTVHADVGALVVAAATCDWRLLERRSAHDWLQHMCEQEVNGTGGAAVERWITEVKQDTGELWVDLSRLPTPKKHTGPKASAHGPIAKLNALARRGIFHGDANTQTKRPACAKAPRCADADVDPLVAQPPHKLIIGWRDADPDAAVDAVASMVAVVPN